MRFVPRRAFGALVIAAFAVVGLTGATAFAGSSGNGGGGLSKHDRALLAQAKAEGESTVVLIIASKPGANRDVVRGIEAQGGSILNRDDSLGYVLARVATDKVQAVAALDSIEAVDLDEIVPLEDPRPEGAVNPTPQVAPSASTPRSNAYMPIQDTNADDFTAANPTWDGRGVTIGIVDTGVDLDHPSLNVTSTGEPKIVDWVTGTLASEGDPTWLDMSAQVTVSGGSFTFGGKTYSGAADGSYRFATFNEASLGAASEYGIVCSAGPPVVTGADLNRNGTCNQVFAVLWRTADNKVFVDDNADGSFAGEPAMTDFKVNRDKGYFGTDNSATVIKEAVPFVVQTDGQNKRVNIGIVSGAHGSHVAGITSGNALFGGAMSGQAPGAKIVSLRACLFVAGCTTAALTDGMVYVAKQSNVDVINMSIGGLPSLNDGNNARCVLYTRLIDQSNVQMFLSAGNSGSGLNTVGDPSVCGKTMSVGSYISKDSWQKNYGSDSDWIDNLHGFSSRGPREDGALAPQIVAPGSAVSTVPTWQVGQPVGGTYVLPPGYGMFNGTSMAAPQATGAAALLISAAKQAGIQKQPDQLRQAFKSSTRLLDASRIGTYEQGVGLIDVPAAWNLLKTNLQPDAITSSVPVNTVLSGFLATPGVGAGIYDREGVTAGQSYKRIYTFTRTSGGGGAVTYNLSWLGNDGTFSAAATSISLAKNSPASLEVTVNPTTSGIHSAVLRLDDPSRPGIEYDTSNVVVAADVFTAAGNYSVTKTGTIGRNQTRSFFFRVPAATPAFKVDFSGPTAAAGTGQARFLRFHPYGVGIDSNASNNCYSPPVAGAPACDPNSRTTTNPQAGVWEVTVEGRRTSDAAVIPFTLTASILGATVSPNPDLIPSAAIGVPVARSYTLTNVLGAFTGKAVGTPLGSAFRATPTIANLAQQQYQVTVTPGSTSLRATIGGTSDPAADLDLFVFRPNGTLAGQSADGDSEESVTVPINATTNPAGVWTVLVDGYAVPAGTTTYNYVDVFANPAFGAVSVTDADALRPSGSSWTVPGSVTVNAAPAAGRVLLGNVQVRTSANVLVGSGDVIVQSVTP